MSTINHHCIYIQKIITCAFWLIMGTSDAFTQDSLIKNFSPDDFAVSDLVKQFGSRKSLPTQLRLPALVALAHYPELKKTRITIRLHKNNTVGTTVFTYTSLWKNYRHYVITINNDVNMTGILPLDVGFNAQVGMIAHELSHVAKFQSSNTLEILSFGIKYLFKKNRSKIERATDMDVIDHGLGWQLFDWYSQIFAYPLTTAKYKQMKTKYYLQPIEILEILQAHR